MKTERFFPGLPQPVSANAGSIFGKDSKKASWIVRGDASGTYQVAARFYGTMSPFEASVAARFTSNLECEVQTGEGLEIIVHPEDAYYPGEKYYIQFEVINKSAKPFYNVKTSFGQFEQAVPVFEWIIKDWNTKEVIEYERYEGMDYHITDINQKSVPVLYGGERLECGILPPGGRLYGTYCITAGGDEEKYYRYVDGFVKSLTGKNLGVRVGISSIESHVEKYLLYMDQKTKTLYGDPIDITTGAFLQDVSSFSVEGSTSLLLGIHYNSTMASYKGECGYGWSHDYEQHIEDHGSFMNLYFGPYAWTTFVSREAEEHVVYGKVLNDTVYIDKEAVYEDTFYPSSKALEGWSLLRTEAGYEVTSKENDIYFFDKEGRLSGIRSQGGKSISICYAEGQMTLKDDVSGKQLHIFYNEEGLIERISDDSGREAVIAYNGHDLVSFTNADGQREAFVYDGSHHLIYGADAKGITYVENTYDEKGRILTQKEGGSGTEAMLSYEETEDGGLTVHIRNHNGESRSVTTNGKGEKIRETDEAGAVTEYTYDDVGNLLTEKDNEGNVVNYDYDEEGKLISYVNKAGEITSLSYDENGYVASVMEEDGTGTRFAYDETGSLLREISPLGAVTRYAYDEKGNAVRQVVDGLGAIAMTYEGGLLTGITDYNGSLTAFGYDEWGNRCLQVDAMGNRMETVYDETGKILLEKGFDGTVTAYTYDAKGQKIEETVTGEDGKTRTVRYGYDGMGRVVDITNEGGTTAYTYDGEGNTTSVTYPDGSRDTFAYDRTSNLIKAVTASGMTTEYTYDSLGNKITEKTGDSLTSYEYDGEGRIHKIIQPTGEEIVYTYDKRGNCLTETDGRGNSYVYTYDAASNLTSSTDPLGNKTCYSYDIYGRCVKVTDPKGNSTAYAYDGNGNCIRQTDELGTVTEMTYDALNRLTKTCIKTSEGENTTSFTYDKAGRVIAVTDGEGNTVHAAYDSFGNLTVLTDAEGNRLENNTYDGMGQLVSSADALGNITAYSYDRAGNITEIVECLNSGQQTEKSYTYDVDGRILASVDEEGGRTAQTYDENGNIISVTDPMGGISTYSYDSMNRITEIINAIGVQNTYTYSAEGLLSESRNGKGEKTSYTYDGAGRIISRKDKEGTIRYTYDENGNVLTVTDKKGTISRTYDCLNRVTDVTDYKGNTISYGYDELGNRISITYPGGEKVRYSYDKAGNLLAVTDAQGGVTRYTYDKNGRLILTERADGSRETRAYDGLGQLKTLKDETKTGEVISDLAYEYDGRGNIVGISGMEAGSAGFIPGAKATGAEESVSAVSVSVAMTYDADNRLLTYNGQSVEYDACGNMLKGPLNGGMAEFTYDCRNRLVKVKEADGKTTVYEYDAEDIRTAQTTGGIRTEYITDREAVYSQVLVKTSYEKNVFGVYSEERERTTYIYGTGLISERRDDGEEYLYHYNHLGSAAAITDGNGEIVFRIVYGTYGELYDIRNVEGVSLLTAETAKGCTAAEVGYALGMEYLYNGQYGVSTGGNGLYYMRARYYNQDIKRFINRDILSGNIGNSQSLNRYCYVQGNPVSLTDPFGLCPTRAEVYKNRALKWLHTALDAGGFLWDGFDVVNVLLYHFEGRDTEAAITLLCLIPGMGNFLALPIRLTLKLGDNAGEALIKLGKKYFPDAIEKGSRFLDWAGGKVDDVWRWIQKKLGKAGAEGGSDIKITFPQGDAQLKHIFRDAEGHILDTPTNRQKILDVTSDLDNYLGKDAKGNDWYAIISEDGKQTWVRVRNGVIDNAGVNDVPRIWDPETGLYNNTRK